MIKYVFLLGLNDWAKNLKQSYFILCLKMIINFYINYLPLHFMAS